MLVFQFGREVAVQDVLHEGLGFGSVPGAEGPASKEETILVQNQVE